MEKHVTWNIPTFDPDNYASRAARVAQKVVLEEIYLVEAKTWRKPGIIPPDVLTLKNKGSTEIIYPKEYKNRPDLHFTLCKFGVTASAHKSPNKPVMKIEASFYTCFSYDLDDPDLKKLWPLNSEDEDEGEGEIDPDLLEYLYRIMPISITFPYWREVVQNMSTRMGFPALMVPLLKIVQEKIKINIDEFE